MTCENPPSQAELLSQFAVSIEKIPILSEKTPVFILFVLGTLLIMLVVLLKRFSYLAPIEFTTLVLSATLLLVLASLIRLYQYKGWREVIREQQKLGGDLMRHATLLAADRKKQRI